MAGIAGATMESARRREIEMGGDAAGLQEHGRKTVERGGLLGDPQRICQFLRLRYQKARRIDAVEKADARRVGIARLTKAFGHADPQKWRLARLEDKPDEGQREAGGCARVAGSRRMDFGEACRRQAAAQRRIEPRSASSEKTARRNDQPVAAGKIDVVPLRRLEPFRGTAFDLCNPVAQGRNRLPRQGR